MCRLRSTMTPIAMGLVLAQTAMATAQTVQDSLRNLTPSALLRVVGGIEAPDSAWPWQVLVLIPLAAGNGSRASSICGGSLIASRWVLTAAHCFHPEGGSLDRSKPIAVAERKTTRQSGRLGDVDLDSAHRTKALFEHPRYNKSTNENDIALLRLSEPARLQSVPVLVAANDRLEAPPVRVTVTGWGRTREIQQLADGTFVDFATRKKVRPDDVLPKRLMQVELSLVGTEECRARYRDNDNEEKIVVDGRNLCAAVPEGGKDSCQGDSGGPIVVQTAGNTWLQVGIVSGGNGCARPGYPGVYTRVSAHGDWVRSVLGKDLTIAPDGQQEKPQPAADDDIKPGPDFDNAAGVAIGFDKGDTVKVGDLVSYRVTTRKPGYLAIFDATPDGRLTQVFPNARSLAAPAGTRPEAARIGPERPLLVPDYGNSYRGFDMQIEEPRGKGLVIAVLSDEPIGGLDIPTTPKTFASDREAMEFIKRLGAELRRKFVTRGLSRVDPKWSVDVHEYTIR